MSATPHWVQTATPRLSLLEDNVRLDTHKAGPQHLPGEHQGAVGRGAAARALGVCRAVGLQAARELQEVARADCSSCCCGG